HQLDRDRAVEALGRLDAGEAVRSDVERRAGLQAHRAHGLARGRGMDHARGVALAVDEAVAERDEAWVERDPRVGQVDLAACRAADAQPVTLDLALRLQRLAGAAPRLGAEEPLYSASPPRR